MEFTKDDAPHWLQSDELVDEWVALNNDRLRVWSPDEAPAWLSAKWAREKWADNKTKHEMKMMSSVAPCVCEKCGKPYSGFVHAYSGEVTDDSDVLGYTPSVARNLKFFLCVDCEKAFRDAVGTFTSQWMAGI